MASESTKSRRLRAYHFGATLVAIGLVFWLLFWVKGINKTTEKNLDQTFCNQGILTLATLQIWHEDDIVRCDDDIEKDLREKYHDSQ